MIEGLVSGLEVGVQAAFSALQAQGGWILLLPFLTTFVGASLQRATGFGFGFIAGAGTLTVFNPIVAVTYTSIANMLLSGVSAWQLRGDVNRQVSWRLIAWMSVGILFGLLLIGIALRWWLQALALAVTIWAVYEGVRAILKRRRLSQGQESTDAVVEATWFGTSIPGILSGFLGTCLGIPGPPIIGYLMKLGLGPYAIRATLLAVFSFNSLSRLILFPLLFSMPTFDVMVMAIIVAMTIAGTFLGAYLGRVVPKNWFAYINIAALSGSGMILAFALANHFL